MSDIKFVVAKNLIKLRKENKLTQEELANKINYSDKAVSKWERGEATPDITTLKQIADLFNVDIRVFFDETTSEVILPTIIKRKSKLAIALMSIMLVWLVMTVLFVVLSMFATNLQKTWLCFLYAIPISAIVGLVFATMWSAPWLRAVEVTILIWTLALCICLTFNWYNMWLLFCICVPLQIIVVMWFAFLHMRSNPNGFLSKELHKYFKGKKDK